VGDRSANSVERGHGAGQKRSASSIEGVRREIRNAPFAHPEAVIERLMPFSNPQVLSMRDRLPDVGPAAWPPIGGCLAVLFTSRSGSTYLARELECVYAIGRMREALNLHRRRDQTPNQIVKGDPDTWFSFKAGPPGVIAGELSGFFDAYLEKTSFVLLLRRDIIAQAVSNAKSVQTGQWNHMQEAQGVPRYDGALIAKFVAMIALNVEILRLYMKRSERPSRVILYEDFASGDFESAEQACDFLGVPRRAPDSNFRAMPVERMSDATNEAWAARFREEIDSSHRDRIQRYLAGI
jgi:trehalose 2-sulfotransferase